MPARRATLILTLALVLIPTVGHSENWPQFRGPGGNATSRDERVPINWSDTENIAWKAKLPGRGASSPVVWGDRVFLTAFTGYGMSDDAPGNKSDLRLHLICLDRSSGKTLWDESIAASEQTQNFSRRVADHGYATSTPATDGEAAYAFFGVSGIVAYDFSGRLKWRADVGSNTAGFGSASSPVVFDDLLVVNASIESGTVFAFDKRSGVERWRIENINRSWTSPCIAAVPGAEAEMVINQKETIFGFDPRTGKQLWWCDGIQDYVVPVPISHAGVVYCLGGRSNRCIALRLGGRGDVTQTHRLWQVPTGANVTSPIYYEGHVYWASDKAVANCLNAETGRKVYQKRMPTSERIYASIVRAGNRLYVTTRDQGIVVLAAQPEYEELARNVIASDEGLVNASPAISNNQLLLRTDSFLYCIGQQAAE